MLGNFLCPGPGTGPGPVPGGRAPIIHQTRHRLTLPRHRTLHPSVIIIIIIRVMKYIILLITMSFYRLPTLNNLPKKENNCMNWAVQK